MALSIHAFVVTTQRSSQSIEAMGLGEMVTLSLHLRLYYLFTLIECINFFH